MRASFVAWGLLPLLALFGCGPYDVPITETYTFPVDATEGALCQSTGPKVIDLSKNQDFQDNRNRISRIEITEMRVTIVDPKTQPDSVATTASGKVTVAASSSGTGAVTLGTYRPLTLAQGETGAIQVDQAGADKLVKLIETSPYQAWIHAEGCVDKLPAHFTFEVEVSLTVYVRLL